MAFPEVPFQMLTQDALLGAYMHHMSAPDTFVDGPMDAEAHELLALSQTAWQAYDAGVRRREARAAQQVVADQPRVQPHDAEPRVQPHDAEPHVQPDDAVVEPKAVTEPVSGSLSTGATWAIVAVALVLLVLFVYFIGTRRRRVRV